MKQNPLNRLIAAAIVVTVIVSVYLILGIAASEKEMNQVDRLIQEFHEHYGDDGY